MMFMRMGIIVVDAKMCDIVSIVTNLIAVIQQEPDRSKGSSWILMRDARQETTGNL